MNQLLVNKRSAQLAAHFTGDGSQPRNIKNIKNKNMISRNFNTEPKKDNPHGVEVHKMYDDPSAQIMHMTLQPGQSLKPHATPVDVVFYVLEGNPTVLIGEETQSFGAGTIIESPAHIVHSLSNESEQVARLLVIKAPRPTAPGKIV